MISDCNFSYKHYIDVLESAKTKYSIGTVNEFSKLKEKNSFIILRHDVDLSLDNALRMAEIEAKNDLHSTYFILLHSQFYNALSEYNIAIIKKISELGHEIGLHYDTTFLINSGDQIMNQISKEAEILSNMIDMKINSIAQHNTSITPELKNITSNFLDPMKSEISEITTYISDSVQNWRRGCMCNHINMEEKLQILTHPIWWNEYHKSRDIILEELKKNENEKLSTQITNLKEIYTIYLREHIKK